MEQARDATAAKVVGGAHAGDALAPGVARPQAPPPGASGAGSGSKTICCTRHCPPEMRRSHWSIDQFVVAKKLGGGYASTVHLAICKATGSQVAIKVYHRCKLSQLNNYQVHREIRIHACLDHKHVLALYAAFEDDVGVYLISEYASRGDVFGELDRRGGSMTEADAVRQVLAPFLSALEYLHLLNIIHRDIKPENLLFTAAGVLKVADFGLSIDITQERPVTRVGTLDYMAPEVVVCPDKVHPSDHKEKTHLHYTYLVDAWAVGVLAYELTVGRAPFDAGHKRGTIDNILHAQPRFPAWISDSARHFVSWSLTKDAAKRPGIQQLAEHPWIHQHAAPARPARMVAAPAPRAASCHSLPVPQALQQHAHHKACGGGGGGEADAPPRLTHLAEDEEAAHLSGHGAAAAPAAAAAPGQQCQDQQQLAAAQAAAAAALCGSAQQQQQQQQLSAGGAGSPGVLGAAADKLRAFVHRCQSANDMEGLRAFMLQQPAEPSNACFEPGGRFFTGPAAASSAPAPPKLVLAHDSATSVGGHSNPSSSTSSSSRPADLPRPPPTAVLTHLNVHVTAGRASQHQHPLVGGSPVSVLKPLSMPAAAGCFGGMGASRPLQLVKLPQEQPRPGHAQDRARNAHEGLPSAAHAAQRGHRAANGYSTDASDPMSPGGATPPMLAGSPMAVSPAALVRSTSAGTQANQGPQRHAFSTTSTESCSSSCDNAGGGPGRGDASSICSSHSWGYGGGGSMQDLEHHQQQQHQQAAAALGQMLPPRPHTPPHVGKQQAALLSCAAPGQQAYSGSGKLAVMKQLPLPHTGPCTPPGLHQQAAAAAAASAEAAAAGLAAGGMSPEGHGSVLTCKGGGTAREQQQTAALTINSCFGFLKTAAARR